MATKDDQAGDQEATTPATATSAGAETGTRSKRSKRKSYDEWLQDRLNMRATPRMRHRSFPVLLIEVRLESLEAQRAYARGYEMALNALNTISGTVFSLCPADHCRMMQEFLDKHFDRVMQVLAAERKRCRNLCLARSLMDAKVEYTHPAVIQAPASNPKARALLDMLHEVDGLMQMYDKLWLAGEIDAVARRVATEEVTRLFERFCRSLSRYAQRAITFAYAHGATAVPELEDATLVLKPTVLNGEAAESVDKPAKPQKAKPRRRTAATAPAADPTQPEGAPAPGIVEAASTTSSTTNVTPLALPATPTTASAEQLANGTE